jgi:hypothetical protein
MHVCKYCGATNPATVFNCLKCAAVMPVQPAPVQNIAVKQHRKPRVAQVKPQPPAVVVKHPVTELSLKDFGIYFGVALLVVGLFAGMFFFLIRSQPLSTPVNYKATSSSVDSGIRKIKSSGGILLATSEENFAEMMRADDAALLRMGVDGKVFRLQDGAKIRVIDGGLIKSKVAAIDGVQAGRAGWLPNEFIGD